MVDAISIATSPKTMPFDMTNARYIYFFLKCGFHLHYMQIKINRKIFNYTQFICRGFRIRNARIIPLSYSRAKFYITKMCAHKTNVCARVNALFIGRYNKSLLISV